MTISVSCLFGIPMYYKSFSSRHYAMFVDQIKIEVCCFYLSLRRLKESPLSAIHTIEWIFIFLTDLQFFSTVIELFLSYLGPFVALHFIIVF